MYFVIVVPLIISKLLDNYCLTYESVKAVNFFEVTKGLNWIMYLSSSGRFKPLQVKGSLEKHISCIFSR
jgi:hypothetical protein